MFDTELSADKSDATYPSWLLSVTHGPGSVTATSRLLSPHAIRTLMSVFLVCADGVWCTQTRRSQQCSLFTQDNEHFASHASPLMYVAADIACAELYRISINITSVSYHEQLANRSSAAFSELAVAVKAEVEYIYRDILGQQSANVLQFRSVAIVRPVIIGNTEPESGSGSRITVLELLWRGRR